MDIFVLMQRTESKGQSYCLPLKAFYNLNAANLELQKYNASIFPLHGLKLAYSRLLRDWLNRHNNDPDLVESLEKEKDRLINILELDPILELHGILIEDEIPTYYLVTVELDNSTIV